VPTFASFDEAEGKRALDHAAAVVAIATICAFLAYAASVSFAAIFNLEAVDSRKNAAHAFYATGSLGIIGALIHLTLT
jgi:hypothetical protein